jgi:small subunit ribosomal protein S4
MGKYTGPKCRECRKVGLKLFLKGSRCETSKCALDRTDKSPGSEGTHPKRLTGYAVRLREVQRAKRLYGLRHEQFKRFFRETSRKSGDKGEHLIGLLERRLDNVVYRLRFSLSRGHARQLITHRHITVNGKKVRSPSFLVKVDDKISPVNSELSKKIVMESKTNAPKIELPSWLRLNEESMEGVVVRLPSKEDIQVPFDTRLIVEYMSR